MADKPRKKKPRHTQIVLPEDNAAKRNKREPSAAPPGGEDNSVPPVRAQKQQPAQRPPAPPREPVKKVNAPTQGGAQPERSKAEAEEPALPENAIVMPQGKLRKKRRWGKRKIRIRLGFVFVLLAVAAVFVVVASGTHFALANQVSEWVEGLQISANGGNGYPVSFAIAGYKQAQSLPGSGFAVLGELDMAIFSQSGKELYRLQHGYANPSVAAGNTRVCVYNRGSREYTVTGRTKSIWKDNTQEDILFAEMSPGGWLALCTASRYRADLEVYSPVLSEGLRFKWSSVKETPLLAAFHSDNRTLALGCIAVENGAMASVVYVFRVNQSEDKAQLCAISNPNAIPVQTVFLAGNRLLVLYDAGYAAVYDLTGQELFRYSYGGRRLTAAEVGDTYIALVFGSSAQENSVLVTLSNELEPMGQLSIEGSPSSLVATAKGVYLLVGQEVLACTPEAVLQDELLAEDKAYGLVWGGQPLLVTGVGAQPLAQMLDPAAVSSTAPAPIEPGGENQPGSAVE